MHSYSASKLARARVAQSADQDIFQKEAYSTA